MVAASYGAGVRGRIGNVNQRVQTFSYTVNKFWGVNV